MGVLVCLRGGVVMVLVGGVVGVGLGGWEEGGGEGEEVGGRVRGGEETGYVLVFFAWFCEVVSGAIIAVVAFCFVRERKVVKGIDVTVSGTP